MAKTEIKKANIQKKKTNHFSKDECIKEISRLVSCGQDKSKYADSIREQARELGVI